MKTIYIGVGNTFRRDDGAGIYIVRALKKQIAVISDITFAESHGEGTAIMALWQGYKRVVLFDAVMARGQPGKLYHLLAGKENIPTDFFKYSSHAFSVAEAVELARVLGTLPDTIEIYGVEGKHFEHGEEISEEIRLACDKVVQTLVASV